MARGGKRPGSGRKKGSVTPATKRRQDVALQALQEGKTPLDVLLEAMRDAYALGGAIGAMQFAKEAAPYVHPKLSSIEAKVDNTHRDAKELTDADLTDIAAGSSPRAPESQTGTH
jgi:hypothetical protein